MAKYTINCYILLILMVSLLCYSGNSFAYKPVARVDVVPLQTIKYGASFNFGVIAFSKPGINRVELAISGQGYSGGTKTITGMALNTRVASNNFPLGVWEYWAAISANEFSSNGQVTVTATVYDNNGNSKVLDPLTLIVEGASAVAYQEVWVSNSGDDATGTINDRNHPYQTIEKAVDGLLAANGNDLSGCTVYLFEGTYTMAGSSKTRPATFWLTITKDQGAAAESVIINDGGSVTSVPYIKASQITIQSPSPGTYVFQNDYPKNFWTDRCRVIGSGRWNTQSNPLHYSGYGGTVPTQPYYSTSTYSYDMASVYSDINLVRGGTIEKVGNDVFHNTYFVVNTTVDDVDNGTTGLHSDVYQMETAGDIDPQDNVIVYNLKATDDHCQGVFLGIDEEEPPNDIRTNIALVNVLVEARDPANENESGQKVLNPFTIEGGWDHLLVWNCSFPYAAGRLGQTSMTNSSFVGNIFWQLTYPDGLESDNQPDFSAPGNSDDNDFIDNHYFYVRTVTPNDSCVYTSGDGNGPCPAYYAKGFDSDSNGSRSIGDGVLDANFKPLSDSVLFDRFASKVPVDICGTERGATSDVGAIEYTADSTQGTPTGSGPMIQ